MLKAPRIADLGTAPINEPAAVLRLLATDQLPLPAALRQYQVEGIAFLLGRSAAVLADGMGLGKTVQAAIALRLLLGMPDVRRALIIVPASLRLNWLRELGSWAPDLAVRALQGGPNDRWAIYNLPIPVILASYDQIRADLHTLYSLEAFDLVVLDEAQKIRNRNSTTSLACKLIPRKRSWVLTGTPLENRVDDLVSIYDFVSPKLLSRTMPPAVMHDRIQPTFLRRRKQDVLPELPPIITQEIVLELSPKQGMTYDEAWEDRYRLWTEGSSRGGFLALITRLKQICNFDPTSGESTKLDALLTFAESWVGPDDKILIFSQYVETLKWLQSRLGFITTDMYHGQLDHDERDETIQRFEASPGPRVLLASLQAGGLGLNLNSASLVLLYDRWWNPAVEDQAVARAHRYGRTAPLHVIKFLITGSIEERIATVMTSKRALFDQYVEAADSAEVEHGLSRTDLMRILDLPLSPPS
jgi:SNF2 family DNA or RNA helicase